MTLLGKLDDVAIVQEKTLDAAWLRNEALSQNLANIDTPNYKRKDVDFEKYLRGALTVDTGDAIFRRRQKFRFDDPAPDLKSIRPTIREEYNPMAMRIDGNNLDIDEEMAQMAKNIIKYNVVTQNLNSVFSKIKHAVSEGRR